MSKDTPKLINQSLNILSRLVESDTNVSIIDLNLLENLNTNQSLNYSKLENDLNSLEQSGNQLVSLKEEFDSHSKALVQIEEKIAKLERIMTELDSWLNELETT
ncbi:hypothetical protein KGF56_004762 [Candida oxycetoniae]|uniref:Uncharacterized protein n=1 Tax=Candida oxycetoniae TaxID=497107 RepID=A0AAI9SSE9_9ASCO|nr:uncharacterized protein KGF56_004762 [Candida oxycetoniae]KAI3402354.2 hypothetical protein KGF56_004762 [Candida oxycetoniae]